MTDCRSRTWGVILILLLVNSTPAVAATTDVYRAEVERLRSDLAGRPDRAEMLFQRGVELSRHGSLDEASRLMRQLFIAQQAAAGKVETMRQIHQQAASRGQDPASAHNALGELALFYDHSFDQAIAEFKQVLRIAPADLAALGSLGLAQQWSGDLNEAMATYRHYLVLADPEAEETDTIRYTLLNLLCENGEYQEAMGYFRVLLHHSRVRHDPTLVKHALTDEGFRLYARRVFGNQWEAQVRASHRR
jgi:tetratricopeptide (TPR) repeat protein